MNTVKKIIRIYAPYKISILLLLIGIPVISKLNVYSQTMLGTIVDNIANADEWIKLAGIYTIIVVALFIVKQGYGVIEQRLSFKTIYTLRTSIAKKVLLIHSESLNEHSTNDILQMWNDDVEEIQNISVKSVFDFLILILSAFLALWELGNISIYFPLIALSVNILSILPIKIIGRKNKVHSQKERESQVAMNEKFYMILDAIRLVKTFGKEEEEISKFEQINSKYVDDKLAFSLSNRIYKSVISSLKAVAPTVILLMANFQIRDGRMTIGDIVLATTLLDTISKPFSEGGRFMINLKAIGFKFDHLFQFLDADEEQSAGAAFEENRPYEIEFKNVSYQANGNNIVEHINFSIGAGEKVAVVGESGSGKTTLSNLLLRLYLPSSGNILLHGRDIRELDLRAYRKKIHYSQSNTYITNASIMENLTLLGGEENLCIEMAKAIRFHDEIMAMPEGYSTVVDAGSSNLSGGQKKKIAIIRALAQNSQLYVFDEITRGIDEMAAASIMNYLLDYITGTAIFVIHNFHAMERMDKIIVMQAGHIVAEGRHADLYQSCNYYRQLYDNRKRDSNG